MIPYDFIRFHYQAILLVFFGQKNCPLWVFFPGIQAVEVELIWSELEPPAPPVIRS